MTDAPIVLARAVLSQAELETVPRKELQSVASIPDQIREIAARYQRRLRGIDLLIVFRPSKEPPHDSRVLEVEIRGLPVIEDRWRIIGILVAGSDNSVSAVELDCDESITQHTVLAGECDHCATLRTRRYTLLARCQDQVRPIGLACARELTGIGIRDSLWKALIELKQELDQVIGQRMD